MNLRQRKKISSGKEELELDIPVRYRKYSTSITQKVCTEKPKTTKITRVGNFHLKRQLISQVKKLNNAGKLT